MELSCVHSDGKVISVSRDIFARFLNCDFFPFSFLRISWNILSLGNNTNNRSCFFFLQI